MPHTDAQVVVVGVDAGHCGDDAIELALDHAAHRQDVRICFLHVLAPSDVVEGMSDPVFDRQDEAIERAAMLLGERVQRIARERLNIVALPPGVQSYARIGKPAEALLHLCADMGADLLVVGTHARHGVNRLLLGSVAESLVRRAPCPVLVARPRLFRRPAQAHSTIPQ